MAKKHRPRKAPRIEGGRDPILSCLPPAIAALVRLDAALYDCFPSGIVGDILARYYGDEDNAWVFTDRRRNRGNQ